MKQITIEFVDERFGCKGIVNIKLPMSILFYMETPASEPISSYIRDFGGLL